MRRLSVSMSARVFRTWGHANVRCCDVATTYTAPGGRCASRKPLLSPEKLFRGNVRAMADVLVSLRKQPSLINTPEVTSRVACTIAVSVCGTLEWLQGPVRSLTVPEFLHDLLQSNASLSADADPCLATAAFCLPGTPQRDKLICRCNLQGIFISWCCSLIISAVACQLALPLLRSLRQPIRATGPASHFTKAGTPTAAGCIFLPLACAAACAHSPTARVVCACAVILIASAVGFLDDYFTVNPLSLDRRGLTAAEQLFIQITSGTLLAAAAAQFLPQHLVSHTAAGTVASVKLHIAPWLACSVPPLLYQLLCAFTYVSEVNAVNLTDGLDGLAATSAALVLAGTGLALQSASTQDLQALCASLSGAVCGFAAHNRHPAAVFMGNCGSHGLGAAIAAVAALGGAHGAVALLSMVLAIEAGSTVVQLGWYAWTKRRFGQGVRLLRMAPLHHHLEMCGWHEASVVALATVVQVALVMLAAQIWC